MHIDISGKDFQLTPALKSYVEEKLGRLGKFQNDILRIRVELDVDHSKHHGDIFRADVWVHTPRHEFRAGEQASTMNAAIDLVYPKLERQMVREKQKTRRHTRPDKA